MTILTVAVAIVCAVGLTQAAAPPHRHQFDNGNSQWVEADADARTVAFVQQPSVTPPAATRADIRYFNTGFALKDVDVQALAERLRTFGFELPFTISGLVTFDVRVGIPINALLDGRAYRMNGHAESARLVVAGLELRELSARATYEDGVLELDELQFQVPDDAEAAGVFVGRATFRLIPSGDLNADVDLEGMPLQRIAEAAEVPIDVSGRVSGKATARVALEQVREVTAWQANADLQINDARVNGLPPLDASATIRVEEGVLELDKLTGTMQTLSIEGAGQLQLDKAFKYSSRFSIGVDNMSMLNELPAEMRLPVDILGRGKLLGELSGTLAPLLLEAKGSGTANDLHVERLQAESLKFEFWTDAKTLKLTQIEATVYGGSVSGSTSLPFVDAENEPLRLQFQWDDVDVSEIIAALDWINEPVKGKTTGKVTAEVPADKLDDLTAWLADGQCAIQEVEAYGCRDAKIDSHFRLAEGSLNFSRLVAQWDRTTLELVGTLDVVGPLKFDATVKLAEGDLAQLEALPPFLRPPVKLAGRCELVGKMHGQLQPLRILGDGSATARDMTVNGAKIDRLKLDIASDGRQVKLSNADAALYGGEVRAALVIPLEDTLAGAADLNWQALNVGELLRDMAVFPQQIAGIADGKLRVEISPGKLLDVASWQAEGDLAFREARLFGWIVNDVAASFALEDQQLSVADFHSSFDDGRLALSGRIKVVAPFDYAGHVEIADADLAKLNLLPESARPPIELAGIMSLSADLQGKLDPMQFKGRGSGSVKQLAVAGAKVDSLSLAFDSNGRRLGLRDVEATLYGGNATGSAEIPYDEFTAGKMSLHWEQVDIGALLKDTKVVEFPVDLSVPSDGDFDAEVPPGKLAHYAAWTIAGSMAAEDIRANELPVGNLRGELKQEDETIRYDVQGALLHGRVAAKGLWPLKHALDADAVPDDERTGTVLIEGLQLSRVGQIDRRYEWLTPLNGVLDLSVTHRLDETGAAIGEGQIILTGLAWDRTPLADRLQGQFIVTRERMELADLSGTYADGRLRGAATILFSDLDRSWFSVSLSGAESSKAFVAWPDLQSWLNGPIDLQLRGNLGRPWRAGGTASLRRAEISGVQADAVRLPLDGTFDPETGAAELMIRGGSAQISRGRCTGDMRITWSRGVDLDGTLRFSRVDLRTLLKEVSDRGQVGRGQISGTLTLSGQNIRSMKDLKASLQADLRDTQAMSYPLLSSLVPYMSGGISSATTFDEGELRATLAKGAVQLERLSLASRSAQILASGNVSAAGRLDIDVVASTERLGQNRRMARVLLAQFPAVLPAPVSVLVVASQYLEDRIVYLQIGGTMRQPTARVRPLPTLREEIIRLFLRRAAEFP